jgi:cytochrome c-type biogenesis protein CcmE
VVYKGILPDLFKEGKGVVAEGKIGTDGVFNASQVLAKHDENYMPPEAAHALEQAAESPGNPGEITQERRPGRHSKVADNGTHKETA